MRPPSRRLAPQGQNHQAAGDQGTPPPPPPPPSPWADGGRLGRQRPRTPGGRAAPGGGTPRPRQARPRAKRPWWTTGSLPHYPLPTGNGPAVLRNAQTKRPTLVPAWRRRGDRPGREDLPAPPPRHTDPPVANRAAPGAHGCPATWTARVYPGGARQRGRVAETGAAGHPTGQRAESSGAAPPPPPSPPRSPPGLRAAGAPTLRPPRGRGDVPPPREGTVTPWGGAQLDPHPARPRAPHCLLLRGSRPADKPAPARQNDARATPGSATRRRTGAV